MSNSAVGDAAIAVVRRNTEEVQGKGNWGLFEELFADDFVDHTPQPPIVAGEALNHRTGEMTQLVEALGVTRQRP
jgi:hypothetical protein